MSLDSDKIYHNFIYYAYVENKKNLEKLNINKKLFNEFISQEFNEDKAKELINCLKFYNCSIYVFIIKYFELDEVKAIHKALFKFPTLYKNFLQYAENQFINAKIFVLSELIENNQIFNKAIHIFSIKDNISQALCSSSFCINSFSPLAAEKCAYVFDNKIYSIDEWIEQIKNLISLKYVVKPSDNNETNEKDTPNKPKEMILTNQPFKNELLEFFMSLRNKELKKIEDSKSVRNSINDTKPALEIC